MHFDWENKWLRGDQYAHMLWNINKYCKVFQMEKLREKQHPENIYVQPKSKLSLNRYLILFVVTNYLLRYSCLNKCLIKFYMNIDGQVYFVRADSIGSDFGFPRLGIKKRYKW